MKVQTIYHPDQSTRSRRPLFMASVSAGFPSPAEDYIEGKLDLNKHLETFEQLAIPPEAGFMADF